MFTQESTTPVLFFNPKKQDKKQSASKIHDPKLTIISIAIICASLLTLTAITKSWFGKPSAPQPLRYSQKDADELNARLANNLKSQAEMFANIRTSKAAMINKAIDDYQARYDECKTESDALDKEFSSINPLAPDVKISTPDGVRATQQYKNRIKQQDYKIKELRKNIDAAYTKIRQLKKKQNQ